MNCYHEMDILKDYLIIILKNYYNYSISIFKINYLKSLSIVYLLMQTNFTEYK